AGQVKAKVLKPAPPVVVAVEVDRLPLAVPQLSRSHFDLHGGSPFSLECIEKQQRTTRKEYHPRNRYTTKIIKDGQESEGFHKTGRALSCLIYCSYLVGDFSCFGGRVTTAELLPPFEGSPTYLNPDRLSSRKLSITSIRSIHLPTVRTKKIDSKLHRMT